MANKNNRRYGSMLRRIFALIVGIVFFSLSISAMSLLVLSSTYWMERTLGDLSENAGSLAGCIERCMDHYGTDDVFSSDDMYLSVSNAMLTVSGSLDCSALILDADGNVLLCSDVLYMNSKEEKTCAAHRSLSVDPQTLVKAQAEDGATYSKGELTFGNEAEDMIAAAKTIKKDGAVRYYVLLIKPERAAFREMSEKYSGMVIFSSSVAVGLSFIAAYLVSYRVVLPLRKISEATQQYAKGNFSVRINAHDTYNEIHDLADSVNSMAEDLAVIETSRSNFVANISHELKTPMTIISGFIDGILDGTVDPSEQKKYLTIVSEETKRLSRLVVDMLNMSKIEAGKLTLNYSSVELSALLLKILLVFEPTLTQKSISVDGLESIARTTIVADEGLLYQVFFNLLDNAVKFTPENGKISVSVQSSKKTVSVTIRNTGKGIPEEERGRIFERFYKVDQSRGLDSRSFGIGLPIAKSIVDLHNGSICINSEENEYTEFVVTLPADVA